MTRRSVRTDLGLALVALTTAAGCQIPNFQGPQVQNPPIGFLLQNDSDQFRRMFPDREVTLHTAWIKAGNGPYSGIYVNGHPGAMTYDDVAEAQVAAMAMARPPETTFSPIERLTIDGRSGWGWEERLETNELGLAWVTYRALVPYDTVSYAIDFYSGDPAIKMAAPDTLRTVVASFAVGKTKWNLPLIAILGGLMIFAVSMVRSRQQERTARLKRINLVKIPIEDDADARPASDASARGDAAPAEPIEAGELTIAHEGAPSGSSVPATPSTPLTPSAPRTSSAPNAPPAPPAAPSQLESAGRSSGGSND